MPRLLPALVAEAIGVFALCFVGILSIRLFGTGSVPAILPPLGLIGSALAQGLIFSVMMTAFVAISGGHFNPAVTVGLLVGGKIEAGKAVAYIAAQLVGGVVAGLVIMMIFSHADAPRFIKAGTPAIGINEVGLPAVSAVGGCFAEMVATFLLVTAYWGTIVESRTPRVGGFGVGMALSAGILAIGPLTGAAMNPARAFGPALAATIGGQELEWGEHWIYWIGPLAGGILASLLYRNLFLPKPVD